VSTLAIRRRNLADVIPHSVVADATLIVGAALFVGVLAQFSMHIPGSPVPVTGQTLGVMLAGAALGWRRAIASMSLYAIAGLAGVPWFAGHSHGYVAATFGYVLGFIAAGAILGSLAARTGRSVTRSVAAMVLGEVVLFGFGVSWLALDLHVSLATALHLGFTPFLVGDAVKVALAGIALPTAWRAVERTEQSR
jgi:biotin transport system substrate-specific component